MMNALTDLSNFNVGPKDENAILALAGCLITADAHGTYSFM